MTESKSTISKEDSYHGIGEYWDSHDVGEVSEKTEEVRFEVNLESDIFYYPVEESLSSEIRSIALERGISTGDLVDLWLREKVKQETVKAK